MLDRASLTVNAGDRIGLIGRNGTGKSSLLNAIAGLIDLDDGEIKKKDGLSLAMVEQEPVLPTAPTLRASLALRGGLDAHAGIHAVHDDRERWRIEARLIEYMHRLGLDEAADPAGLSGGERKRGARALFFRGRKRSDDFTVGDKQFAGFVPLGSRVNHAGVGDPKRGHVRKRS